MEAEAAPGGDVFVQPSLASTGTTPNQLVERYRLLQQIKAAGKKVDRIRSLPAWPGRVELETRIDELLDEVELV